MGEIAIVVVLAACLTIPVTLAGFPARAADALTRERVVAVLPDLERLANKAVRDGEVPGLSIGVVFRDEAIYLKGFGVREVGRPELVDADTVFQLASCSKPIASTVVAALVGERKLSWDSRIADLDPEFQLHNPYVTAELTVADLFAHRSGLPGDAGNELQEIGYSRAEILHRLRLVPPSSSFRAGYSYSNSGLTEGAVAAARAAGTDWENAAEEKLFRPLGMVSTSARYRDFVARPNRVALHIRHDGQWAATQPHDADVESPAGGISSSARDLTLWMRLQLAGGMLRDKSIVDAAALARTHEPIMFRGTNPDTGLPNFYGLGWGVQYGLRGAVWSHSGAFSQGVRTAVTLASSDQLGIVILTGAFPSGVPEALAEVFMDLVDGKQPDAGERIAVWNDRLASLFGPAAKLSQATYGKTPSSLTAALPAAAYVRTYSNAYLGAARITEADGGLRLRLGPDKGIDRPLAHYDRDLFTMVLSPELPDTLSALTFRIAANGKAGSITVGALDDLGLGTLTRDNE